MCLSWIKNVFQLIHFVKPAMTKGIALNAIVGIKFKEESVWWQRAKIPTARLSMAKHVLSALVDISSI